MTFTPGNGNGNGGGDGTVVGLTDRYEELPAQTFSVFAHAGTNAASPTRDIQTALDSIPSGAAHQVLVGPGSYAGATVTIPSNLSNVAIIGPTAGDFGGTVVTLSSGRGLTIGNNATRVRVVSLQVEGLTTVSTSGSGVHRIERSQLEGGLTIGAISSTIYVVGCTLGNVTVDAGFTGTLVIDRSVFAGTYTNNALLTRVLITDSAGLASAPSTTAVLNGRFQLSSGVTLFYADGALLLKSPVSAINGLTAAADRIAYYTSSSAAAMTALTSFGRGLIDDADAAAARTTLGLGTTATTNTGTSSGQVPVLGASGLPAVGGSLLTGITASQVSGLGTAATAASSSFLQATNNLSDLTSPSSARSALGLGSAATLTAGPGANNLVQLDGSARLPAVDGSQLTNLPSGGVSTSCSWTVEWLASGGVALASSGWTLTGLTSSGITTDTAGASYERLSTSGTTIGYLVHATHTPGSTEAWEFEVDWAPSNFDGATALGADEGTSNIRERMVFDASDNRFESAAALAWGSTMRSAAALRQVWTMRRQRSSHTTVYVDGMPVGRLPRSSGSSGGFTGPGNSYCVGGCQTGGSTTRTYDIYAIRIRDAGVCAGMPWARHTTEVYGP